MPPDENSLPRLLDLRMRISECAESDTGKELRVDLRIQQSEITAPEGAAILVKLKSVTLALELEGLNTEPTSHLGEPVRELAIVGKQTTTVKAKAGAKLTAKAGANLSDLNPFQLSLAAEATVGADAVSTYTSKQDTSEHRVKARGGDTWEVSEPRNLSSKEKEILDGTYLLNDALCKVTPSKGANMKRATLEAFARQRDMVLDVEASSIWHKFASKSQEKLFKILMAQSLGRVGPEYSGVIRLSRSEAEIED